MTSESGEYLIRRPVVWIEAGSGVGTLEEFVPRQFYGAHATGHGSVGLRDRRVEELARLLRDLESCDFRGWDGDDAQPVTRETLDAVEDLLVDLIALDRPLPDTAPAVDGSVCMEWHWIRERAEQKIFVDIGPSTKVMTLIDCDPGGTEERHFPAYDGTAKAYMLNLFDRTVR